MATGNNKAKKVGAVALILVAFLGCLQSNTGGRARITKTAAIVRTTRS